MEAEKILVVDDNKEIVYSISELLKYEGYETLKAYDGMEALDIMERENVDLILLDVMMPRLNGLSALMKLREKSRIPVIILSAKTEESDKVSGLTLGADDYIEKPYNPAELIARVKAHLRRYRAWSGGETEKKKDPDQIVNGGLVLDKKQRVIFVEGEEVHLTATEYKILELLMVPALDLRQILLFHRSQMAVCSNIPPVRMSADLCKDRYVQPLQMGSYLTFHLPFQGLLLRSELQPISYHLTAYLSSRRLVFLS